MEASTACTSGADAIVRALAEAGARLMFGVPGGGPNLDVVGAAATAGLRFVLAHGETAAVIMAATCADLTGTPGAVVVTRGAGALVLGAAVADDRWCVPVDGPSPSKDAAGSAADAGCWTAGAVFPSASATGCPSATT